MKNLIIVILMLLAGGGGGLAIQNGLGASLQDNRFEQATNSSVTLTSSSTTAFARGVDRQYASICNASTTGVAYVKFATSTDNFASTTTGILLASSSCYEIDTSNLFLGRVELLGGQGGSMTILTVEK